MMNSRFTEEQRLAIDAKGRTIVSASAGSGKTTVMIEKIIRLIKDACGVDEILAVTFTKKAASQMKEKLSKALIESINAEDATKERKDRFKKQLSEVPSADISTIHSFCAKLIRSHFFVAEIDNTFRVIGGDDAEGTALKNEALDELLEEGYEEKDEQFTHLLNIYWRKKSDNALRKIIVKTYEHLRDRADYRDYLERSMAYDEEMFENVCKDLLTLLQDKCSYYCELLEKELYYFEGVGAKAQITITKGLIDGLKEILSANDYFAACQCQKPTLTAKNIKPKDDAETSMRAEKLAFLRKKVEDIYKQELAVTLSKEQEKEHFLHAGVTAAALAKYLLRFDEKYERLKKERNVLDYNDLEHKALTLLKNEDIVQALKAKYRYVFVDEYQDVNPVQEEIISRLSGDNLFLVGDVKQSIYGFRGSKSKFFVEKQKEFERGGNNNLAMTRNFRSSDAVLDAVNSQFVLAMTTKTSSVDYKKDSYMERGGRYALNDGRVQIHVLEKEAKTAPQKRGVYSVKAKTGKKKIEESCIAKTIRSIIEKERASTYFDPDSGEYKRVNYSDIAILTRKNQGEITKTVAALAAEGIPITATAAVNICEYAEVKTLMDILSLIDNAKQDIPLCSALLSPMGNLTAEDLTNIRLAYKNEPFFRLACEKYALEQTDSLAEKLHKFYAYFTAIRAQSRVLDAGELLVKLLSDTRMEAALLSQENGIACLKRIHRFIEEATATEPLSVHAFLEHLRDLDYSIEYSENGGDDSVKVLTMHSSKGLEYPIVILDNLSANFKGSDSDEVFAEEKYALAPRAHHEKSMTKNTTLLRRLHDERKQSNSIADELNLYYVALTRAKYGLHMLFEELPPMPNVRYARSFAELTDFDVWQKYFVIDEIFDLEKQERTALVFRPDEKLTKEIMEAFQWKYNFTGYENLPVKSSATALLETVEYKTETDGSETAEEKEEINTDKESGIVYHAFLERFDFADITENKEVLTERIEALRAQMLKENAEGAELLSKEKLLEILQNPVFGRLQDKRLYKEQQFLVSLPIKDTYALKKDALPDLKMREDGEEMIFQGAIDLLAVGEEAEIIDYKYSRKNAKSLREHYQPQLDLYRQAVAKILKLPLDKVRCTIVNIYYGFEVKMD